jgi:adenylate cyclase
MFSDNPRTRLFQLAALVIILMVSELLYFRVLLNQDNQLNDAIIRSQALQLQADNDIVLIDIDEASIAKMAKLGAQDRWPWPRSVYAELIYFLSEQKPAAIVFDISFNEPDSLRPELDQLLIESISEQDNVFMPMYTVPVSNENILEKMNWDKHGAELGFSPIPDSKNINTNLGLALPIPGITRASRIGNIRYIEDDDGVGRRYLLQTISRGWKIPSLPAKVAAYLDYNLPDSDSIILHWRGNKLAHQRYSFFDIYHDLNSQNPLYSNKFNDKIVIIGTTATGLGDNRTTPVSSLHPGVEILATAIDNLKNNRYMRQLNVYTTAIFSVLIILGLYILFIRLSSPLLIGFILLIISAGYLVICYIAIARLYLPSPVTPLVFAWLYYAMAALHQYLQERKSREKAITMFSRFLDPHVVNDLVGTDTSDALKSRSLNITVLFSDIRGFTTLSENRNAEEILTLLNKYFSKQVKVIFQHGGTMDKFIGDAVMAFWGAPVDDPQHALHAVQAALDMSDTVETFRNELEDIGNNFDIGIGIHSGVAVVGMIGFEERMDYTCIGDTVNLASRIEGQTKGVSRILVSEETRRQCGEAFDFIDHGFYKVKGREQQVRLFEPRRRQ